MQASLGSMILFVSMFLHMICRPFEEEILDTVETYSLASSVIALTSGGLLLSDTTPPLWKMIATVLIFVAVGGFVFYVIAKLIYAVRHKKELADLRTSRLRAHTKETSSESMASLESGGKIAMKSNPMLKPSSRSTKSIELTENPLESKLKKKDKKKKKTKEEEVEGRNSRSLTIHQDAPAKKSDWTKHTDPKSGRSFWYNDVTKESTWKDPEKATQRNRTQSKYL